MYKDCNGSNNFYLLHPPPEYVKRPMSASTFWEDSKLCTPGSCCGFRVQGSGLIRSHLLCDLGLRE